MAQDILWGTSSALLVTLTGLSVYIYNTPIFILDCVRFMPKQLASCSRRHYYGSTGMMRGNWHRLLIISLLLFPPLCTWSYNDLLSFVLHAYCDASPFAMGFWYPLLALGLQATVHQTFAQQEGSISYLESLRICAAILDAAPCLLPDQCLAVFTDNISTVQLCNSLSALPAFNWMSILVADTLLSWGINLWVFYVLGVRNEITDVLSHLQNCQLTSSHLELVISTFQPPWVALGVARLMSLLPSSWAKQPLGLPGPWSASLWSIPSLSAVLLTALLNWCTHLLWTPISPSVNCTISTQTTLSKLCYCSSLSCLITLSLILFAPIWLALSVNLSHPTHLFAKTTTLILWFTLKGSMWHISNPV